MKKLLTVLAWVGVGVLGLATAVLEDLLFLNVIVPYAPVSWDITGDMFWVVTVPTAQLMALAVTVVPMWLLAREHLPRLITFWAFWTVGRAAMLHLFNNPPGDILIYLLWILLWCAVLVILHRRRSQAATAL